VTELIGDLIDAAVNDPAKAARFIQENPQLLRATYLHGGSALHFLAVEGFLEGVRVLADLGADVNQRNDFGDTPLIDVVVLGNIDMAKLLLQLGADPSAESIARDCALHCALELDHFEIAEALIVAGADVGYKTDLGETIQHALPEVGAERERILRLLERRTA
jgi:ankyrin repeat protein